MLVGIKSSNVVGFFIGLVLLTFIACDGSNSNPEKTSLKISTVTPIPVEEVIQPQPTPTYMPTSTATVVPSTSSSVSDERASTPTADPGPADLGFDVNRFKDVPGIVDTTNFGWPRDIETSEGLVTLEKPPIKVHSLSLGHTEILAALMDFSKISAVYSFFTDPEQSNIADLAKSHNMIGFDPEEVVALEPEIVIASRFTDADNVALLKDAGIPVARASLENSALGNVPNILLIGYMVGAEKEAVLLADEIEDRMKAVGDILNGDDLPRVLSISKFTSIFAAGSDSTEGGIIEQAGGINAAADSGIEGHQQVTIEGIAAINPDVIVVPQPIDGAHAFIKELKSSAALFEVPALMNDRIYYVMPKYHTTLSHWNVRGVEEMAALLFPSDFQDLDTNDFSHYTP
ncbi:MAG: ABC transporter substrate-binding protein [SAR202 cluster bacterium]|nr:ABC transporter substrate-binding protein [SAR202 cluster bacterium]|tara:strand:+ start:17310 stop:18515 length:1206 start_codon:yes stop_codon:yes gene_type:complete